MNERIEQLAEQCWVHTNEPLFAAKSPHWEFDRQKFAELIVGECISILNKRFMGDLNREDMEVHRCIEDVKKHFGVEE